MTKLLEVIVTTAKDAIEAEAGGADRLEVVRDLAVGGLTPDFDLVGQIMSAVRIPLRIMLRENPSMGLLNADELESLCAKATEINSLGVDGVVTGFILNGQLDTSTMNAILNAASNLKITVHRAFDELADPLGAIKQLQKWPQVDRILTVGGPEPWPSRKLRLHEWQRCAAPGITILAGAGVIEPVIEELACDQHIKELHVGRAARIPRATDGQVCRLQVARLKGLIT